MLEAYALVSATIGLLNIRNQFLINVYSYNTLRKNMTVAWIWDVLTVVEE